MRGQGQPAARGTGLGSGRGQPVAQGVGVGLHSRRHQLQCGSQQLADAPARGSVQGHRDVLAVPQDPPDPCRAVAAGTVFDENPDTVLPGLFDGTAEVDRPQGLFRHGVGRRVGARAVPAAGGTGVEAHPTSVVGRWCIRHQVSRISANSGTCAATW